MLGEMVAKRQTESQQHPRKFTRAAAWEGREPCSWSQEASGGSCWSLVPAGQSVRTLLPCCRPAFRTQTTWPPQKRREGRG